VHAREVGEANAEHALGGQRRLFHQRDRLAKADERGVEIDERPGHVPILRALATRAPYFHNGSASDLGAVADFYNQRFGIGLTDDEKADLVAFLLTL
jgi:cytochrome c peroxidase